MCKYQYTHANVSLSVAPVPGVEKEKNNGELLEMGKCNFLSKVMFQASHMKG